MRSIQASALIAALAMSGKMGGAELLPPISGPRWPQTGGLFRGGGRKPRRQIVRLGRATGPGSYNADNEMRALVFADKGDEAIAHYELDRTYTGKPMRRWELWYALAKQNRSAGSHP